MSTIRGRGGNRIGGNLAKVRRVFNSFTRSAPSNMAPPSSMEAPSSATDPTDYVPSSSNASPRTSSVASVEDLASDTMVLVPRLDSSRRIIVSIYEYKSFVGGVPSPSRWFARLLQTWKWVECYPSMTGVPRRQ